MQGADEKDLGYLYIKVEMASFDKEAFLFVQPFNKFVDNADSSSAVLRIYNGFTYIVPGNVDALIYFDPQASYGTCQPSLGS